MARAVNAWSAWSWLEFACWAVGIALLATFAGARLGGEWERRLAIADFTAGVHAAAIAEAAVAPVDALASDGSERLAPDAPPAPVPSPDDAVAARAEVPSLPVALLRIPRVGLEVPVFADTTERNLNRGAGWVEGTAAPDAGGNFAVAAHRDSHFRVLKDVAIGDVLELQSIASRRNYRVVDLSIVAPEDVSPLRATDAAVVTLVTCYPFYFVGNAPQRFIVRATAVE